jgi:PAS domain-containing protein
MAAKEDLAHPISKNLYELARTILGDGVSDNEIARRWGVDPRVFNDLKHGRIAVPRIERLRELAEVLGVNEHFVYAAGAGVPTNKLMVLIKRQDVSAAVGALVGATHRAKNELKETEEQLAGAHKELEKMTNELELRSAQLHALLEQIMIAVLTLDGSGNVLHLNQMGRELYGVDDGHFGVPLAVAMKGTVFLDLEGQPFDSTQLPSYVALRSRQPAKRVFSVHRPGTKGRLVAGTATPMMAGKRFIGVVSVLRDIEDILAAVGGIGVDMPLHPRTMKAAKGGKKKASPR